MLLYIHRCAGVSEWQTMWTQNPLVVIPCGFDPHHRHKNPQPQGWGFFAGGGGRTERRWKHRKQSPSGALFSSRVSPYWNQYRGRSRGRFKIFPSRKAGGFLLVAGVEQSGGGNTANKAPVGLCLARGCHRMGISTGAEAVDGLRFSPAARLFFCWAQLVEKRTLFKYNGLDLSEKRNPADRRSALRFENGILFCVQKPWMAAAISAGNLG